MEIINEDKWGEEVWVAANSQGTNSRDTAPSNLILYWGKHVSFQLLWAQSCVNVDASIGQAGGRPYAGQTNR